MTEKEIIEKLHTCIENAFECYLDEVGGDECEDGEMFFSDGYFHIVLHDGRLCKTPYTAADFMAIRSRRQEDFIEPYVVIYMKNGDKLYYYNFEWADYLKTAWQLIRVGQASINDESFIDVFETYEKTQTQSARKSVEVVEYEEKFAETVKDLLVELQTRLAVLDESGIRALKENYREGYFAYLMAEIGKHEGKMLLAQSAEGIVGLVACKIFHGGEEQDLTTSCPKIGFISDLVVAKGERRKGIGTALLVAAETYFAEHGCTYTQLEVSASNIGAKRLYENFGFGENYCCLSKKTEKV